MRWIGVFLVLPLALAAPLMAEDTCSITGQVSNAASGEPLRRALVYLRRIDSTPGSGMTVTSNYTVTSDSAGRFAIAGITPGRYRLSAEHNGFIVGQYGARGPAKAGTVLNLEAGQKASDLAIRLTQHGVIAGRVVDEDGEPMTNVDVQVLRQQYMQGRKQLVRTGGGMTNDLGEYRAFGLQPGHYYLSAVYRQNSPQPQGEDEYVATYYPRTTDPTGAAPLDLSAGAQLRNIDIALARAHTVIVTGRVINEVQPPAAEEPAQNPRITPAPQVPMRVAAQRSNLNVMISARNAMMAGGGLNRGAMITPTGTFEFRSVTPGSYYVTAMTNVAGKTYSSRTSIQVGNTNLEGVSLTVRAGVPVNGHVQVEGESSESVAKVRLMLQPAEPGAMMFGPMPTGQIKEDGTFLLEDVGSDRYNLSISGLTDTFFVKSVRSANLDVLANGLEISGVSPAPIEVVLSAHPGQVSGTVMDAKAQKPAAQMTVVLIPQEKERRDREGFYRVTGSDASGGFTFKGLTPGEYRVYAWDEVEFGAWMDPAFMKPIESKGEAVSVTEGGRLTVQMNVISTDSQ